MECTKVPQVRLAAPNQSELQGGLRTGRAYVYDSPRENAVKGGLQPGLASTYQSPQERVDWWNAHSTGQYVSEPPIDQHRKVECTQYWQVRVRAPCRMVEYTQWRQQRVRAPKNNLERMHAVTTVTCQSPQLPE